MTHINQPPSRSLAAATAVPARPHPKGLSALRRDVPRFTQTKVEQGGPA